MNNSHNPTDRLANLVYWCITVVVFFFVIKFAGIAALVAMMSFDKLPPFHNFLLGAVIFVVPLYFAIKAWRAIW